jgi:cytochrome-b5 reductase
MLHQGYGRTTTKRFLETRLVSNLSRKHEPRFFRSRNILIATTTVGIATAAYLVSTRSPRGLPTSESTPLSPSHFIPVTLTSSVASGSNTKLLSFHIPHHLLPARDTSAFTPVWSVYVKDDDIQVERPYTPLEGIDDDGCMKFWIKKYPKGEVGRWLHSKSVGESIEIRGPVRTWEWKDGVWDDIVMVCRTCRRYLNFHSVNIKISGGTGITPFYQLFHTVVSRSPMALKTRFTLLHSSRTPSELPPPSILHRLGTFAKEFPGRFRFHLFVDSANGPSLQDHKLHVRRISKTDIEQYGLDHSERPWWPKFLGSSDPNAKTARKVLFLVCGPDQ